jgi:nickel-dependent lactate racemase
MQRVKLAYGRTFFEVDIPDNNFIGVYEPLTVVDVKDEHTLLQNALAHPIGSPPLRELARTGGQVVIITSDLSRPCPSKRMLPHILTELESAGVKDRDIIIVLALGLHRKMTPAEIQAALGTEIVQHIRVLNHDIEDTLHVGVTSAGTPVEIYRPVIEAQLRICLGNLEFHYFAGYSGGAKALFPGCASRAAIAANHSMIMLPEAAGGRLEDNPLRVDLEEAAEMVGVDFILNVVVDSDQQIVGAVTGDVTKAHRNGCQMVAESGMFKIPRQADIVLASSGGFPKDINILQAQKGLDSAAYFVRQDGVIIWVAECPEGYGNPVFEQWMREATSPDDILERIQHGFIQGAHKAVALVNIQKRAQVFMISSLPDETIRDLRVARFDSPQAALTAAFDLLGDDASVMALPQAASIMPDI